MDIPHETPLVSLCCEKPEQSVISFLHRKDDKGKEYYGIRGSQLRVIGYELLSIVTNIWRQFP